ncbi:hypothetical protein D3C87_1027530 [compost metagenome]
MNNVALAIIVILIFFLGIVSTFWIVLTSYRFTELLESYLDKSKFVASNRKVLSHAGLVGLLIRNCAMALMFLIPRLCEKRGLIEKDELLNLPIHLKRKLLVPWIISGFTLFAASIYCFFVI